MKVAVPAARVTGGKVKHAWCVGQAVVEVAHGERVIVPRLVEDAVGAPFKGEGPRIAAEAGVERHGEPANAENERPEVHHAMLVAGHGVHLVAQVGGGHAGILDEGDPRVDARKFPREGSHEPVNECENARQQSLSLRSLGAATIAFLCRSGGALAGTMTFSAFTVIRGGAAGTGSRQLFDRRRSFLFPLLFLAHDASS